MLSTTQAPTPPSIPNPAPGQQVPLGDQCPHCGVLKTFWLYNPFTRTTRDTGGWLLWRSQQCDCPDRRPPPPPDPELQDLDHLLHRAAHRHLTFSRYPQTAWRRSLPAYRFCVEHAKKSTPGSSPGLCLWGAPSEPREHLLAALVNAARAQGCPTALISFPHALELLAPPADVEAFRPARAALRRVPVLAVSGLFADPATPLELKGLHQLLDDRHRHMRTTHVTMHRPPADWRLPERERSHVIQAEIALLIERLCLTPVQVPA